MSENKAQDKLFSIMREHLSDILINVFIALLIWLFGVLVFLPAAYQIASRGVPFASNLAILIGFSVFIIKAVNSGLRQLLESTSDLIAYKFKKWKKPKISIIKLQKVMKNIVYIFAILCLYILYYPFLVTVHPALNGLVLIPIILWIFWTLIKTVNITLIEKDL